MNEFESFCRIFGINDVSIEEVNDGLRRMEMERERTPDMLPTVPKGSEQLFKDLANEQRRRASALINVHSRKNAPLDSGKIQFSEGLTPVPDRGKKSRVIRKSEPLAG